VERSIEELRKIVRLGVPYPEAYMLLGQIYEELGRRDNAVEVYRQAQGLPGLLDADRMQIEARIQAGVK